MDHRDQQSRPTDKSRFSKHLPPRDPSNFLGTNQRVLKQVPLLQAIQSEPDHVFSHRNRHRILKHDCKVGHRPLTIAVMPDEGGTLVQPMNMVALLIIDDHFIPYFLDDQALLTCSWYHMVPSSTTRMFQIFIAQTSGKAERLKDTRRSLGRLFRL